jgi:signal transduction histidine kinase
MIAMPMVINMVNEGTTPAAKTRLLCGIANRVMAERICRQIEPGNLHGQVSIADNLIDFVEDLAQSRPRVIVLDDELVGDAPLLEFLRQLNESAPVVLIASSDRQNEVAKIVAGGKVEFVGRQGDYTSLAAHLALRHLAPAAHPERAVLGAGMSDEIAEIFRHDINNPLTGILGNAELVLSHGAKLAPADIQRLQTVVDLAVRLRETIRRLSNAWGVESRASKSAEPPSPL